MSASASLDFGHGMITPLPNLTAMILALSGSELPWI